MAVRNLARTVIEVGRTTRSKDGRKQLRRMDRRDARNYCHQARLGDLEELGSAPLRRRRDYSFMQDDKLGPAMRWLDSKVGEKWDDIYSELSEKFRGRGIALSHVVDQHMLAWVDYSGTRDRVDVRFHEYVVDEDGILRRSPDYKRTKYRFTWVGEREKRAQAAKWAGERKAIVHGARVYWGVLVPSVSLVVVAPRYRQEQEFSEEDYAYWADLPSDARRVVTYLPPRS